MKRGQRRQVQHRGPGLHLNVGRPIAASGRGVKITFTKTVPSTISLRTCRRKLRNTQGVVDTEASDDALVIWVEPGAPAIEVQRRVSAKLQHVADLVTIE